LTPFFSMLYRRKIEIRNMKEVYVAFASHLPFGAVDQVGPHNFKNYLRKKAIASGKCGKDEIAKVVEEMYAAAMKFLSEVKEFETRTGLTIKTEYPPNEGSFMNTPAADLTLVMLEHLFAQYKGKYNLRELIDVFYLGSVISHKTDENAVHAFAKVIALRAGMNRAHAFTEDMACSSGLKGIGLAYDAIAHHGADFAIGGGVEKMSGVPDRLVRFGLTNPFDGHLMAGLADKTATMFGLTREELDDFAFESRQRALLWQGKHRFIASVRVSDSLTVDRDEEVDAHQMPRKLFSKLPTYPVSEAADAEKCKMVTAGNSAAYADGGGLVVLASRDGLKKLGVSPLGKVLAYAEATGSDPKSFILKPKEAIGKALMMAGLKWKDVGHFEVNEAFAAGNVLLMKFHPEITRDKMNRHGGAVAHGHAIGGTGGSLVVKSVDISLTDSVKYYVVSLCHAVDSASAMLLENPNV